MAASAKFLEEALNTDVDESAVNAIVGTLENQLDTNSNQVQQLTNNFESGNSLNIQQSGAINSLPHSLPIFSNQKHEIISNSMNNNNKTFIINNNNNNININNNKNHSGVGGGGGVVPVSGGQQQYIHQNQNLSSNMPKNEPVKLVYPTVSQAQSQATAVLNMNNNRVTLTQQQLPNGTIALSQITSQPQQQFVHTSSVTGATMKTTMQQQQPQTLIIKNQATGAVMNSNSQGIVTMSKPINNQATQNLVVPAGVQIVNFRPSTPNTQAQQKNVATSSPRVVIGSQQLVGARPSNNAITISALQGQPSTLLLKNESGQFQLLRIGPAPTGAQLTPNITSANQTIRLQTVPAQAMSSGSGTIIVNSSITTTPTSYITTQSTMSSAPVPALAQQSQIHQTQPQPQQQQQQQQQPQQTVVVTSNTTAAVAAANQRNSLDNTKEKCRKFLSNLIDLSKREPRPVENNVRILIQDLVDAKVEPEEFCERLERLLNASPQPCLIGFLKKSLPLLRQSLVTKEIVIEGINAPSANVAFSGSSITTQIPAQIRPVTQTIVSTGNMVGQTQIRMVTAPTTVPKIGQTTIRPATPVRIQGIQGQGQGPRLVNASLSQVRPGHTTIMQTSNYQQPSNPPALLPVSGTTVLTSGAQIRAPGTAITRPQSTLQIRPTAPVVRTPVSATTTKQIVTHTNQIRVGTPAQIKHITTINNQNNLNIHQHHAASSANVVLNNNNSATISNSNNLNLNSISTSTSASVSATTHNNKTINAKAQYSTASSKQKTSKVEDAAKKAAATLQSTFYNNQISSMYGDDDINDVAAMGGVNLAEETQRILGSTEYVGTQIRSCKDEVFLQLPALQSKIRAIIAKHGLEEPSNEVAVLISHATQERLKNIVEKLAIVAEHRIDIIKVDPRYEVTKDVRGQIKFLEELDKAEQKRHEEIEREMLMRAAKSRSKTEDPEQAKLKAKAKEMQRAEMEELRQRDANLTALQAIGPRKKPKLESDTTTATTSGTSGTGTTGAKTNTPLRPRIKRVNLRDMLFYLEQEKETCRSTMLYKAYLK